MQCQAKMIQIRLWGDQPMASRIITIGEEKHQEALVSGLEGGLDDPSGRDKAARLIQVR